MDKVTEVLLWLWTLDGVKTLALSIVFSWLVAIAAAIKQREFDLKRLADFMLDKLAPYVVLYGAVKLIGVEIGFEALAIPVWALLQANIAKSIVENLNILGLEDAIDL